MQKAIIVLAGVCLLAISGCANLNLSGAGEIAGVALGATVDPLNKSANLTGGKTIKVGNTETRVNTSTDGSGVSTDADVKYHMDTNK
ncbi:hypothetical protein K8S19_04420 [bacterium]|nr:hypothetical protein [bacterium]